MKAMKKAKVSCFFFYLIFDMAFLQASNASVLDGWRFLCGGSTVYHPHEAGPQICGSHKRQEEAECKSRLLDQTLNTKLTV